MQVDHFKSPFKYAYKIKQKIEEGIFFSSSIIYRHNLIQGNSIRKTSLRLYTQYEYGSVIKFFWFSKLRFASMIA